MILRQFVTGSNAVEEIYIVKSDCSRLVNETIDDGSVPFNNAQDTAEQCVPSRIEQKIPFNSNTELIATTRREECFNIDAKRTPDRNPVSIVKLIGEKQNGASAQSQSTSDKHLCQLCLVTFNTIVLLKQHLELTHRHMLPFRCKLCASREISSVILLNKHFSQHDRSKMHKCSFCEARFDSKIRRSVHRRRFHQGQVDNGCSVGRFTCRYCEKRFVAKANFDRHERNHEKMLALSGKADIFDFLHHCYVCRKQFSSKQTLNEHLNVHIDRLPFRCEQCVSSNVIILSVRLLNKHVALHLEKKPVKCMYCAETFISVKECETHERHNHEENETLEGCRSSTNTNDTNGTLRYECSFCHKSYSLLSTLRRHENVHTGNRQFICKICGKMFNKISCLLQHERTHLDDNPYKCSYCGKGFKETIRLIEHRRIHTGEKPFQCDRCKMRFRLKPLLKEHTVKCTIKQIFPAQDVRCEHCGHAFPSNHLLTKHALESHSQHMSSDGKCRYCNIRLKSDMAVLEHELQHRQPGVIECKHCRRIFKQQSNLRRHQRLHSSNAMPYKCDLCEKSFSQLSTMKTHRRVHTGEKPYKCELCGKCFLHSSTKNRHKHSHDKKGSKLLVSFTSPGDSPNDEGNV